MTEELQVDYLDRYGGFQVQIHQESQCDVSSAVSTTFLGKTDRSRKDVILNYRSVHNSTYFTRWYRFQNTSR